MFIKPKISQEQAKHLFSSKKNSRFFISKLLGRKNREAPEKLEVVYLPFYLFDVLVEKEIKGKSAGDTTSKNVTLSVDGLLGHAVLFAESTLEVGKNPDKPAPTCDFAISSAEAAKIALNQYKGILLEHGLRTRSHSRAGEISKGMEILYPFWIGYFKKKKGYDFKAIDALSGEIQGIKMRRLFMNALRQIE